jgi:AraC-like DNA-binding protein
MTISSTLMDRAAIRFQEAADALRPYVGCFWIVTSECDATIRVVPDGTAAIFAQLQESRPSEWFLSGPVLRPVERRFTEPTTLIGVRLRPGVAFMVSGIAAHSIVDRRIALSQCAVFRGLASIDPSSHNSAQCIDALQRFLIDRLEHASVHAVVAAALRGIDREHGCVPVATVAARCGVSTRHLNRLMRLWVGYGPKRYASIVRFQMTLLQMEHAAGRSVAFLASETGYFDQAHLTVDVGRFAGATPGNLLSRGVSDFSKTRCDDLP